MQYLSQKEIYTYPQKRLHSKFLRKIIIRKKKALSNEYAKIINVSQIKGLRVPQLLQYPRSKVHINSFLPDYDYAKEPNRSWLANILNYLIRTGFQNFISEKVKAQEKVKLKNQYLAILELPQFVCILNKLEVVSTSKWKSYYVMRLSKQFKDNDGAEFVKEIKENYEKKINQLQDELTELRYNIKGIWSFSTRCR